MEGYDSDETVVEMIGGCSDSPILFGPGSERFMHQSESQQQGSLSLASLLPSRVTVSDQSSSEQPQKKQKQQGVAAKPKPSLNSNSNSKPRKKPASGTTSTTQALQRQQEVVTLLKKLPSAGEGDALFSVWALLKAYDLVELSTLASYVDGSVSDLASLTKKDLADTLSRALQCGKLERELQKTQVQQLPLVVSQSHTEAADVGTDTGSGKAAAAAAVAAAAPLPAALTVTASGWQPISSSQTHILNFLQASAPFSRGVSGGLIEVGGAQLPVEGWGRADTTTELVLNFDDPCFSALRLARQLKPQGQGQGQGQQQQQQQRGGQALNSAAIISALQAGLAAFASSHSDAADARPATPPPVPTLRNAATQTETLVPARKPQQPSSSSQDAGHGHGHGHGRAAVKCCRFDMARLGLGFKSLKSLGGLNTRTVITKVDLVDASVAKLLTVGDELVQINGTAVFGLSFAEQMDCLRTSPRPVFLSFASSA